jgi:putative membrane protein
MHRSSTLFPLAVAGALALAAPGFGQAGDDAEFVKKAASGGKLEVDLGRHAAKNAANPEVRAFAERMVADHGAANRELESVAKRSGLAVPTELEEDHREMLENLTKLRGADLDRAYMSAMVEDHEADVEAFQEQAGQATSEVDRWAARTLPTLKTHHQHAQSLSERIEDAAETSTGAPAGTSREGYDDPDRGDARPEEPAGPDPLRTPDRP